jgi:hypothetical protein
MNTYRTALEDVNDLERRSMIELANSYGGVESLGVLSATPEARTFVENLQAARSNRQRRNSACRDAMVDWLYSGDAVRPPGLIRDTILQDPQRGSFFAEPFSADDLDAAATWLHRQGLVGGTMINQAQGPVKLYLTDTGVRCAEEINSGTSRYVQPQQRSPQSEPPAIPQGEPQSGTAKRTVDLGVATIVSAIIGAIAIIGGTFLGRATAPATASPGSSNDSSSSAAHVQRPVIKFTSPRAANGLPARIGCMVKVTGNGAAPNGYTIVLGAVRQGTALLPLQDDVVQSQGSWQATFDFRNPADANFTFELEAIVLPVRWVKYLLSEATFYSSSSDVTWWANGPPPPPAWIADTLAVKRIALPAGECK